MKAYGRYRRPPQDLEITDCDLKIWRSVGVSWNMKSAGKRAMFRRTACTSARVSTPYRPARSKSSIPRSPRMVRMVCAIRACWSCPPRPGACVSRRPIPQYRALKARYVTVLLRQGGDRFRGHRIRRPNGCGELGEVDRLGLNRVTDRSMAAVLPTLVRSHALEALDPRHHAPREPRRRRPRPVSRGRTGTVTPPAAARFPVCGGSGRTSARP